MNGRVCCIFLVVTFESTVVRWTSSNLLSTESFTTVLTMACISSNRVYARVLQDKLYQLLVNNKNTIYLQSRNHFNATGSIYLSSNRKQQYAQQFNGFNFLTRNLSGSKQVNNSHTTHKKNIQFMHVQSHHHKWYKRKKNIIHFPSDDRAHNHIQFFLVFSDFDHNLIVICPINFLLRDTCAMLHN